MLLVVYELESSIATFFSKAKGIPTREQCDDYARLKFGGQVHPVAHQGDSSYTVTVGPDDATVVQFRAKGDSLHERLKLARKTHKDLVSVPTFQGFIGDSPDSGLPMYSMNRIPGTNAILVMSELAASWPLHLATVNSLAEFFAQSWLHGKDSQDPVLSRGAIEHTATALSFLQGNLPPRFQPYVAEAKAVIPKLESRELPIVFTHGDLNEVNITVDPASGKITGITNWTEATYQPFGFALYGLENLLGTMNQHGWHYCTNADKLRGEFWKTFDGLVGGLSEDVKRTIRIAQLAGILIRYGTQSENRGVLKARDATDTSWGYLDALLPTARAQITDAFDEE